MKYEFTVTLRPCMYKWTALEQKRAINNFVYDTLHKYPCSAVYELTGENNVHFHAMIELKDFKERDSFLNKWRPYNTIYGKKTCTQLMHEDKWREYLKKDLEKTRQIIGDPIICDSFNVFANLQGVRF